MSGFSELNPVDAHMATTNLSLAPVSGERIERAWERACFRAGLWASGLLTGLAGTPMPEGRAKASPCRQNHLDHKMASPAGFEPAFRP